MTPEQLKECQEAFELEFKYKLNFSPCKTLNHLYHYNETEWKWLGWKAAYKKLTGNLHAGGYVTLPEKRALIGEEPREETRLVRTEKATKSKLYTYFISYTTDDGRGMCGKNLNQRITEYADLAKISEELKGMGYKGVIITNFILLNTKEV